MDFVLIKISKSSERLTRTSSIVKRILFEGKKAVGVEILKGSGVETLLAEKEVILCAGALNSPQILQLSGVGEAGLLEKYNIPVVSDMPSIGQNLQDHIEVYM